MSAPSFGLTNLVALIDCNGIQADGAIVLEIEPVADKWRAFGWETAEIDGNDMAAVTAALAGARDARHQRPRRGTRPLLAVSPRHTQAHAPLHMHRKHDAYTPPQPVSKKPPPPSVEGG